MDSRRARDARVTIISVYVINTATAFAVHDERLQAEGAGARRDRAQRLSGQPPTRRRRRRAAAFAFRIGNADGERRVHLRDRAHRPQRGAEGAALGPVRRARRAARAGRLLCRPHHRLAHAARAEDAPERGRQLSHRRPALLAARRAVSSTSAELGLVHRHPGGDGRARDAVPDGLQRPAADQYSRRGAAGARRAARHGPGTAPRRPCATRQARPQNAPRRCWRCSARPDARERHKAARRCG